jgi:YidC/Oxa1 family membrane protein insertase
MLLRPLAAVETGDGIHRLANELIELEVYVPEAAILTMRLPAMKPIRLPSWIEGDHDAAEDERPVAVLGSFKPEPSKQRADGYVEQTYYHSWLVGLPGSEHWRYEASDATSLTLVRGASEGLLQFLRYQLRSDRPTVEVQFWAINGSQEAMPLRYEERDEAGQVVASYRLALVALNGVHQDLGKIDAAYSGVYAYDRAEADMNHQSVPTAAALDMSAHSWIAGRSRFFAAYWSLGEARFFSRVGEDQPTVVRLLDGSAMSAATPETALRALAVATPFIVGEPGPMQQKQALIGVGFDHRALPLDSLAPGRGLHLSWSITTTSLSKADLARLDDSERELEYTSGFYRFFRSLSLVMTWLLTRIYSLFAAIGLAGQGYGLAVICLTLLIKICLHRLNYKAQKSMLTMQKLGPELQRLKAQYGNDQQVFMQKQMELWRKHGVNPLGGCLPMLLQFPIFIALYSAFSQATELRGQGFLWVPDLTLPDYTFNLGFPLPLWGQVTINLLPICYIGVALWMALTQKLPTGGGTGADKTQQDMAKMMRFLPVVFGLIFYSMPAGLVLYFTISMALSMVETRYVRKKLGM